jgi:hypothetical protein
MSKEIRQMINKVKNFKQFINESSQQDELDKYWDRQLRQIKDEEERKRGVRQ